MGVDIRDQINTSIVGFSETDTSYLFSIIDQLAQGSAVFRNFLQHAYNASLTFSPYHYPLTDSQVAEMSRAAFLLEGWEAYSNPGKPTVCDGAAEFPFACINNVLNIIGFKDTMLPGLNRELSDAHRGLAERTIMHEVTHAYQASLLLQGRIGEFYSFILNSWRLINKVREVSLCMINTKMKGVSLMALEKLAQKNQVQLPALQRYFPSLLAKDDCDSASVGNLLIRERGGMLYYIFPERDCVGSFTFDMFVAHKLKIKFGKKVYERIIDQIASADKDYADQMKFWQLTASNGGGQILDRMLVTNFLFEQGYKKSLDNSDLTLEKCYQAFDTAVLSVATCLQQHDGHWSSQGSNLVDVMQEFYNTCRMKGFPFKCRAIMSEMGPYHYEFDTFVSLRNITAEDLEGLCNPNQKYFKFKEQPNAKSKVSRYKVKKQTVVKNACLSDEAKTQSSVSNMFEFEMILAFLAAGALLGVVTEYAGRKLSGKNTQKKALVFATTVVASVLVAQYVLEASVACSGALVMGQVVGGLFTHKANEASSNKQAATRRFKNR